MRLLKAFWRWLTEAPRSAETAIYEAALAIQEADRFVQYEAPLAVTVEEARELVLAEWLRAAADGQRTCPVWLN